MIRFFIGFLTFFNAFIRSRYSLGLEILALRQQLGVLKRKRPHARLRTRDRIFWILLRRLWPAWSNVLVIVKPETVVGWHRAGFRLFWRFRSRTKNPGRPTIDAEIRALIRKMVEENPAWGAPRIHGELLKLGFDADRTHDGLEKDTPASRPVAPKPTESARLMSFPRVGGLHHRYDWQQAASSIRSVLARLVPL